MESLKSSWMDLVEDCLIVTTSAEGYPVPECDFDKAWAAHSDVGPMQGEIEGSWLAKPPTTSWKDIVKEEVIQLIDGIAVDDIGMFAETMEAEDAGEEEEQEQMDTSQPDTRTNLNRRREAAARMTLKSPCECCPVEGFQPDATLTKKQQRQQIEEKVHFRYFHGVKIYFKIKLIQSEMSKEATMRKVERAKGDRRSGQGAVGEDWLGAQERCNVAKIGWHQLRKEKRRRKESGKRNRDP